MLARDQPSFAKKRQEQSVLTVVWRHRIVTAADRILAADFSVTSFDRQFAPSGSVELPPAGSDRLRLPVEHESTSRVVPLVNPPVVRRAPIDRSVPAFAHWSGSFIPNFDIGFDDRGFDEAV